MSNVILSSLLAIRVILAVGLLTAVYQLFTTSLHLTRQSALSASASTQPQWSGDVNGVSYNETTTATPESVANENYASQRRRRRIQRRKKKLGDGCYHVFLDVGANIGVHSRFLYEPEKYPDAAVVHEYFNDYFGDPFTRDNRDICAFAFEPNPTHRLRLAQMTRIYQDESLQWPFHAISAGVADKAGQMTFYHVDQGLNSEWGFSSSKEACTENSECTPETVPVIRLADWILDHIHDRQLPDEVHGRYYHHGGGPKVVMKMDVEYMEYLLLPDLILSGAVCNAVDLLFGEFHHIMHARSFPLEFVTGVNDEKFRIETPQDGMDFEKALVQVMTINRSCKTRYAADEHGEPYLHDGMPWPSEQGNASASSQEDTRLILETDVAEAVHRAANAVQHAKDAAAVAQQAVYEVNEAAAAAQRVTEILAESSTALDSVYATDDTVIHAVKAQAILGEELDETVDDTVGLTDDKVGMDTTAPQSVHAEDSEPSNSTTSTTKAATLTKAQATPMAANTNITLAEKRIRTSPSSRVSLNVTTNKSSNASVTLETTPRPKLRSVAQFTSSAALKMNNSNTFPNTTTNKVTVSKVQPNPHMALETNNTLVGTPIQTIPSVHTSSLNTTTNKDMNTKSVTSLTTSLPKVLHSSSATRTNSTKMVAKTVRVPPNNMTSLASRPQLRSKAQSNPLAAITSTRVGTNPAQVPHNSTNTTTNKGTSLMLKSKAHKPTPFKALTNNSLVDVQKLSKPG